MRKYGVMPVEKSIFMLGKLYTICQQLKSDATNYPNVMFKK